MSEASTITANATADLREKLEATASYYVSGQTIRNIVDDMLGDPLAPLLAELTRLRETLALTAAALGKAEGERDEARTALDKINDIRNSIIGLQTMNWSEHVYPLVAALKAAGIEGTDYPEARENYGTMLDRTNAAEADLAAARAEVERLRGALADVEGKCELARTVYATEPSATPQIAAGSFGLLRDFARAALRTEGGEG